MKIDDWIKQIIDGTGGLHAFERCEWAVPTVPRDEAVAAWVIRCLANPDSEGSGDVLAAIMERRRKVNREFVNAREEIEDEEGNTRQMTPEEREAWDAR